MKVPRPGNRERSELAQVALGLLLPDAVFRIKNMYNPWTGTIEEASIWVRGGRVARMAGLDEVPPAFECIDLMDGVVTPGFVDGHVHFESTLLVPEGFAALATVHGVTTIVTDYHEVGCVLGCEGIAAMADRFSQTLLKVWGLAPCPLPFIPEHERTRSSLSLGEVAELLERPDFLGVSEVIGAELVGSRGAVLAALEAAVSAGTLVEGHLFQTFGRNIDACVALGVDSDHEPRAVAEVIEKLRRGLFVMLRQGTLAREVERLAPGVASAGVDLSNIAFVTDDMLPTDIEAKGYFSERLALAALGGYPALAALRAVTLSPAIHYGLHHQVGSLRPGCWADMVVLEDLTSFRVASTFIAGSRVNEEPVGAYAPTSWPVSFTNTIEFTQSAEGIAQAVSSAIRARNMTGTCGVWVMELNEATRFTQLSQQEVAFIDGMPSLGGTDLSLVVCMNRTTGNLGYGFLAGYGLEEGAVAVSMAHDHHNLVAIGKDIASLASSLVGLRGMGGGILVSGKGGHVLGSFPMPVAGLLSTLQPTDACTALTGVVDALRRAGARWGQPLFYLFFLAMSVAPEYRITEDGVLEVGTGRIVDVLA